MKVHPNVIAALLIIAGLGIVVAWIWSLFWLNGITKRQRGSLRSIARLGFWATILINIALTAACANEVLQFLNRLEQP